MNTAGAFVAGSIVAKLLMDDTGFSASVKAINKDMAGMKSKAIDLGKQYQLAGKLMVGAGLAIVGSLGAAVKKTADFGDQLYDLSQITGISAATLSSFKLAADKSGTSLEGVALGLRFLGRNMAGAATGSKQSADAFKALGIKVTEVTGKLRPMDDVMMEVADRFASMEGGADKVALAIKLFGRSGSELIPFLNLGRAGLELLRKEAERLGIVMSDQTAAAADEFKDALVSLKASVQGAGIVIGKILIPQAQGLAEMLTRIVSGFTNTMNAGGQFTSSLVGITANFGVLSTAVGGFFLTLGPLMRTLPLVAAALKVTAGALVATTLLWTAGASAVLYYIQKLGELEAAKEDLNRADEAFWEGQGRIITKLQDVATAAGIHHDVMAELYNSYGIGNVALAEQAIRMGEWESKFPGITAALEQVAAKSKAAYDALHLLATGVGRTIDGILEKYTQLSRTQLNLNLEAAKLDLKDLVASAEATPGAIKAVKDVIKGIYEQLYGATVDAVDRVGKKLQDLIKLWDGVKKAWSDNIDDIVAEWGKLAALEPIEIPIEFNFFPADEPLDTSFYQDLLGMGADLSAKATDKAKEIVDPLKHAFDGLYNDIATGFGDALEGMFDGTKRLGDAFVAIWQSIKKAFFRILGEMVAGFLVQFVKKIIAGMSLIKAFESALNIGGAITGAAAGAALSATGTLTGSAAAGGALVTSGGSLMAAPMTAGTGTAAAAAGVSLGTAFTTAFVAVWTYGFAQAIVGVLTWGKQKTAEVFQAELAWIKQLEAWYKSRGLDKDAIRRELDTINWWMEEPGTRGNPNIGKSKERGSGGNRNSGIEGGINITLHVSTLDSENVVNVVRNKVIPVLREAARRHEFWIPLGSAGGV